MLDCVGGEIIDKSINVTKKGGIIVTIPSGNIQQTYLDKATKNNIDLSFVLVQSSGADMDTIASLLEKGIIKSHISQTFSFSNMQQAHTQLETNRTVGKIVVTL